MCIRDSLQPVCTLYPLSSHIRTDTHNFIEIVLGNLQFLACDIIKIVKPPTNFNPDRYVIARLLKDRRTSTVKT